MEGRSEKNDNFSLLNFKDDGKIDEIKNITIKIFSETDHYLLKVYPQEINKPGIGKPLAHGYYVNYLKHVFLTLNQMRTSEMEIL